MLTPCRRHPTRTEWNRLDAARVQERVKRRFWVGMAIVIAGAAPLGVGYVRSELAATRHLEELAARLPPGSQQLRSTMSVQSAEVGCTTLAMMTLATERGPEHVASFLAKRTDIGRASVAYWKERQFAVQSPAQAPPAFVADDGDQVPARVRKLMREHVFLPDGLERAVVFAERPGGSRLDPRCW